MLSSRHASDNADSDASAECREYVQYVCHEEPSAALMLGGTDVTDRCHYRVELISGGKHVDPMEFPHMVSARLVPAYREPIRTAL